VINFTINPPSGHSHSALDVKFQVKTDHTGKIQIEIFNETVNEKLDILSISSGHIKQSKTIICDNTNIIEGYINLFNKDKLNENLHDYASVDLKCVVSSKSGTEEASAIFFNESQSLDAGIIPFDLVIDNNELDLQHNIPLSMHFVCDSEQRFELCIRSDDAKSSCSFEVMTKKGRTSVQLPAEVIWFDLQLTKNRNKKYSIYWVKFEGVNHMNLMNRKYIPIANSRITFNCFEMMPKPQTRTGPTGAALTEDFVMSNRYFVPTWKAYTSLGKLPTIYSQKNTTMTKFMHESQHVDILRRSEVKSFAEQESNEREIKKTIRNTILRKNYRPLDPRQKVVIEAFAASYMKKSVIMPTDRNFVQSYSTKSPEPRTRRKGCGCSRKINV